MNLSRLSLPFAGTVALLAFILAVPAGFATPLALDYSVTAVGTSYHYDFTLTLDNHDNSFSVGQGFGWLVYGDAMQSASPISDFVVDPASFNVGPWTSPAMTGGFHNGPTFNFVLDAWTPVTVGDSLSWSGTSAIDAGSLMFSTLHNTGGAVGADFEAANKVASSSDPDGGATAALLGAGMIGLAALRRKVARA